MFVRKLRLSWRRLSADFSAPIIGIVTPCFLQLNFKILKVWHVYSAGGAFVPYASPACW